MWLAAPVHRRPGPTAAGRKHRPGATRWPESARPPQRSPSSPEHRKREYHAIAISLRTLGACCSEREVRYRLPGAGGPVRPGERLLGAGSMAVAVRPTRMCTSGRLRRAVHRHSCLRGRHRQAGPPFDPPSHARPACSSRAGPHPDAARGRQSVTQRQCQQAEGQASFRPAVPGWPGPLRPGWRRAWRGAAGRRRGSRRDGRPRVAGTGRVFRPR